MSDFLGSFKKTWLGLTVSQRAGIVFVMLAALALTAGVSYFGGQTEWRKLARIEDSKQLADVLSALEAAKIPTRLAEADTVLVPDDQYYKANSEIVRKGLRTGGAGFELLDKANAFTTSLLEQVNVQRAVMGELEKVLREFPAVASARVLIASEKETWRSEEKSGTAAVYLKLRPGSSLLPAEVSGIQSLVAAAWRTLKPPFVTVVADGKKLTKDPGGENDAAFAAASDQLLTQLEYETQLSRKAQTSLDKALGAGKAIVTVHADLDFDSRTETSTTLDSEARVATSETTSETERSNGEVKQGGAAGTASNLPDQAKPPEPKIDAGKEKTKTTKTEYEVPKSMRTIRKNGFLVKRVSLALLADRSLLERMKELEGIVKSAVGFDVGRGDQFSYAANGEFPKAVEEPAPALPAAGMNWREIVEMSGRAGTLVGLTTLFLFLLKRSSGRRAATMPELASGLMPRGPGVPDVALGTDRSPEQVARASVARNAAAAAMSDPAVAGAVVRSWIEEKSGR